MALTSRVFSALLLTTTLTACGGSDDEPRDGDAIDILDPAEEHYGRSYIEWATAWVQWINDTAPPDCANPVIDTTGEHCALYQDPASDVFLLAGNYGGVSLRDACVVPAGKALFLPVMNSYGDNAGVPEDMLLSDEALKGYAESNFSYVDTDTLHLEVDGQGVSKLERGAIESAQYTIDLAPGANAYACQMVDGVEGEYTGYLSGYWAMLAPLAPGKHTISFGGHQAAAPQGQAVTIDVRYELTVE
jgi:hypothetical protein